MTKKQFLAAVDAVESRIGAASTEDGDRMHATGQGVAMTFAGTDLPSGWVALAVQGWCETGEDPESRVGAALASFWLGWELATRAKP